MGSVNGNASATSSQVEGGEVAQLCPETGRPYDGIDGDHRTVGPLRAIWRQAIEKRKPFKHAEVAKVFGPGIDGEPCFGDARQWRETSGAPCSHARFNGAALFWAEGTI